MLRNRLFNGLILVALVIVIAITVQEAAATASKMFETDSSKKITSSECTSLPSRYSLYTVYEKELWMWLPRTENGPTGIDGGVIDLLSKYQACSK